MIGWKKAVGGGGEGGRATKKSFREHASRLAFLVLIFKSNLQNHFEQPNLHRPIPWVNIFIYSFYYIL